MMAASFLTGLANGYNLSFDPTNITDPSSLLCQQAGMGVGALLNINPAKAASSITKNVTKLGTAILQKEAVGTVMNAVATKATKVFNWCKPCVPIGQVTQKTAQAAEEYFAKRAVTNVTTKAQDVIHVTPQGVALPSSPKYQIPKHYVQNKYRAGSYGESINGEYLEKLRIDPATLPGFKGPNYSHYHINNKRIHYSPRSGDPNPGFIP